MADYYAYVWSYMIYSTRVKCCQMFVKLIERNRLMLAAHCHSNHTVQINTIKTDESNVLTWSKFQLHQLAQASYFLNRKIMCVCVWTPPHVRKHFIAHTQIKCVNRFRPWKYKIFEVVCALCVYYINIYSPAVEAHFIAYYFDFHASIKFIGDEQNLRKISIYKRNVTCV